tara:strand:+ start:6878 stop:8170 length:1293 start_codon:yes stop_codon:yes gene_type:complete
VKFLDLRAVKGVQGVVRLPGSKSISNRVLLLSALASGKTHLRDLLIADDTLCMLEALKALGVSIRQTDKNDYIVQGVDGRFPVREADLFLGNAGTAYRPLAAVLSLMQGNYRLYGVPRMYERPIKDLVDVLRQLGANIQYLGNDGFPPVEIKNFKIQKSTLVIRGDISSQYLTSLIIAAPLINKMLNIEVVGKMISRPYIDLTLALMLNFGVEIEQNRLRHILVHDGLKYSSPGEIFVEGDASSASYFLAAGAIGGGPVRIEGVGKNSIQGDILFIKELERMGARIRQGDNWIEAQAPQSGSLRAINIDCNHIPDAAMTLAVVALFAEGTTTLTNIASWRVKETDRLSAMAIELRKLGATVDEGLDFLKITPSINKNVIPNVHINTYDDHRMAMCFSLVSIGAPVRINDPTCVSKTFPNYFEKFAEIVMY